MRKILISILCLALSSVACLETSSAALVATPAPTAAELPRFDQMVPVAAAECARVAASDAVNLRNVSSAHGDVLTWLKHGELVRVLDSSNVEWWRVSFAGLEGFVKADYLEKTRCDDGKEK